MEEVKLPIIVKSTEEFIEYCNRKYNGHYNYDNVIFTDVHEKVEIRCKYYPQHKSFFMSPFNHCNGKECTACKLTKKARESFIEKVQQKHQDKYDYREVVYINSQTKVKVKCLTHDEYFYISPSMHLRGNGCKKCGHASGVLPRKITLEKFIKKASEKYNNKYDYSKTILNNMEDIIIIICPKHGEFWTLPKTHLNATSECPKCYVEEQKNNRQNEFIEKAKQKYPNMFEYDQVIYATAKTNIEIKCIIHNEYFKVCPYKFLKDSICPKCKVPTIKKSCSHHKRFTQETAIQKFNEVHNNKYDYSKTIFDGVKNNITIICPKHGEFNLIARYHIEGTGCLKCKLEDIKYSNEEIIEKFKKVHGEKYDYSKVIYVNIDTKVTIICKTHQKEFEQFPLDHLNGKGCRKCGSENMSKKQTYTCEEFIEKANIKHNNKYDYSKIKNVYEKTTTKIPIICPIHREFLQTGMSHLGGNGCPKCGIDTTSEKRRKTIAQFIEEATKIYGNKYDYSETIYQNCRERVKVFCNIHKEYFTVKPKEHLYMGFACPKCKPHGYSKKAINWLNGIMEKNHIHIQHAENGGEYKIPKTKYLADGYYQSTNTIYEFDGDIYHGNPNIYDPEKINPMLNRPNKILYQQTLKRNEIIKKLGYNLICIWETDYDKLQ